MTSPRLDKIEVSLSASLAELGLAPATTNTTRSYRYGIFKVKVLVHVPGHGEVEVERWEGLGDKPLYRVGNLDGLTWAQARTILAVLRDGSA